MLNIVLKARISREGGVFNNLKLGYYLGDCPCFQFVPCKALDGFLHNSPTSETSQITLVEGFSISICNRQDDIAFNEIRFEHCSDDSLNFNLPMGLVTRIYSNDGNIDLNFV